MIICLPQCIPLRLVSQGADLKSYKSYKSQRGRYEQANLRLVKRHFMRPSPAMRIGRIVSMAASDFPPKAIRAVVQDVASLLKERKETVSVAETAAGGIISASLLSTPGASGFYKGGLTVRIFNQSATFSGHPAHTIGEWQLYTLPSRIAFAGWTEENIKGYKGPTMQIVSGLAENVRGKLESTYTICESGTAGPTGGATPNRTPGYVALAVATEKGTYIRELSTGLGTDREANMIQFAVEALTLLKDVLKGDAKL